MIIYVDIDQTICDGDKSDGYSYEKSIPIPENIAKVNALYDAGHVIVYWTARGSKTGLDWTHVTERQLKEWGVKYHQLKMGKPYYDIILDDKAFKIEEIEHAIHSRDGKQPCRRY